MSKRRLKQLTPLVACALFAFGSGSAEAELVLPKASPKSEVSQRVGVTDISVAYSSPAVRSRKIFGELVPFGEVWRTGANECTKLTLSTPASIAGEEVEAGTYCLFTIPGEKEWQLALSKNTNLWGASDYNEKDELFRVAIKPVTVSKTERLSFSIVDFDDSAATLMMQWDTIGLPIPVRVKTESLALANIENMTQGTWREYADAAQYVKTLKQYDKALELVEKSIATEEKWYNTWLKATIMAEKGKKADALSLAKKAKAMGDESNFFAFYEPQISKAIADWQ